MPFLPAATWDRSGKKLLSCRQVAGRTPAFPGHESKLPYGNWTDLPPNRCLPHALLLQPQMRARGEVGGDSAGWCWAEGLGVSFSVLVIQPLIGGA